MGRKQATTATTMKPCLALDAVAPAAPAVAAALGVAQFAGAVLTFNLTKGYAE